MISLAPAAGGLNLSIPATLGGASLTHLQTSGGASSSSGSSSSGINYVLSGTGTTLDAVTPELLLSNLPSNLQPSTSLFYYNPQAEDAVLQTAALKQTGQASFVSGLSTDSQLQLSVTDQEKLVLYANATEYAKANDIQLGQALTQQQIGELTQPMLWYVEQTVPQPGCTSTGTYSCPTVTALMPQVYLPANTSALSADGNIVASDSLALNFGSKATGGSILNTGTITSGGSLTVNTGTLTNQQNQVDVGQIWSKVKGGYEDTTGTMVQPGGFMSAAAGEMTLNVSQLNQIGGLLEEVNPDGSANNAATQQLLGQVLQQLGGNFTQTTVSDHLHTDFVAEGGFGVQQLAAMVAAVAASILTAGAAAAALGATLTTMTLGESIIVGAVSAMAGSIASQVISGNGIDFGAVLEAGAVGALTAGLTNGITYNSTTGSFGLGNLDQGLNSLPQDTSTLAQLAGISSVGGALVPQAGQAAANSLPEELAAMGATATISAGVQTAIEGGSFLDNLKQAAVTDAAAAGAFAIGNADVNGSFGSGLTGELGYVTAHGLLGCVAGAAEGTGCAGGAIGGAASAALSPDLLKAIDPTGAALSPGQQAAMEGFATLVGGGLAGLAGANAQGGANAALNEVMNNTDDHPATAAKNGGVLGTLAGAFSDLVNANNAAKSWVQGQVDQFIGLLNANSGQTPPSDPNPLGQANDGNNPPSGTAGAVVTPPIAVPLPNGTIATTPPLIAPGTPILSSGDNGNDTGSVATDQATSGSTGSSSFWSSTGSSSAVENAYGHWDKHMSEFPEYQNAVQYVQGAQDFVSSPPPGTLIKTRPNGDTLLYNPSTNTFAVKTIDGAPRTMFRPQGGMSYWNKQ
ncbi:DUF637 domain-containing protein [Trinickia sp.]|uniref:DUF637 domain-containing protein n=1 Tax=Trinickia sp. TaxID=2571163 RepID=UPI003F81643F